MEYLYEWLILVVAQGLALVSPGPDFVMAVRNSVIYSRRTGFFTALGFAGGIAIHTAYCILGIATVIAQSILLFSIIKYIGAGYLIYIGIKAIRSHGFNDKIKILTKKSAISDFAAFRDGFVTNLFNPKATMFFLALFTQIISPETPIPVLILYSMTCIIMTAIWFSFVAFVLTNNKVQKTFLGFTKLIDRICGGLLIALGVKLAVSKGLS